MTVSCVRQPYVRSLLYHKEYSLVKLVDIGVVCFIVDILAWHSGPFDALVDCLTPMTSLRFCGRFFVVSSSILRGVFLCWNV